MNGLRPRSAGRTAMPDIICTTVYQFPELSDTAKEKARSWGLMPESAK